MTSAETEINKEEKLQDS